jgi:hypothetical protein
MYDFMVFGYFAGAIGEAFFPSGDHFASLMLSLMTFGAGFLMRPIGALVLGAYIESLWPARRSYSHPGADVGRNLWLGFSARVRRDRPRRPSLDPV